MSAFNCSFYTNVVYYWTSVKGIRVEEKQISVFKPEGEISIRIYTPLSQGPEEKFPVLVDFHGTP